METNEEKVNTYRKNKSAVETCRLAQHSDYFGFVANKNHTTRD